MGVCQGIFDRIKALYLLYVRLLLKTTQKCQVDQSGLQDSCNCGILLQYNIPLHFLLVLPA